MSQQYKKYKPDVIKGDAFVLRGDHYLVTKSQLDHYKKTRSRAEKLSADKNSQ